MNATAKKAGPAAKSRRGRAPAPPARSPAAGKGPGALYSLGPTVRLSRVQTKVEIGEVDDPYEREADQAADRVTEGSRVPEISSIPAGGLSQTPQRQAEDSPLQTKPVQREAEEAVQESADEVQEAPVQAMADEPVQEATIQRAEAEEPVQAMADDAVQEARSPGAVQRSSRAGDERSSAEEPQEESVQLEEDESVQPSAIGSPASSAPSAGAAPAAAAGQAIRASGPGSRMNTGTRRRLESGFGTDLSGVRVHDDARSHEANRTMGARAFTHGNQIWLGRGESQNDTRLMAHETTHVLQQGAVVRRQPLDGPEEPGSAGAGGGAGAAPAASVGAAPPPTAPTPVPEPTAPIESPAAAVPMETAAPATGAATDAVAAGPVPAAPAAAQTAAEEPAEDGAPEVAESGGGATESATAAPETPAEGGGGGEGTAAPAPAAAGGGGGGGAATEDILMPEPPSDLSPEERARVEASRANAGAASEATTDLPTAEESTGEARGAVDEPPGETAARAQNALVEALGIRAEPSPEIEELCTRIKDIIESKRPPDEDQLVEADPEQMASEAGGELNQSIEGDTERVAESYDEMQEPPAGEATQVGEEMEAPPSGVETPDLHAEAATPEGVEEGDVSLEADVNANRESIEEAGMDTEVAREITDPDNPVTQSRDAQSELEATAERDPAEVMAEQEAILGQANADMGALQAQALEALASSRAGTVGESTGQQGEMVGSEEQMRADLSARAETVFTTAQTAVNAQLEPLARTAMAKWEGGVGVLSTEFEQHLSRVADWIEDRHSGGWGSVVSVWDSVAGLPDWVTDEYDDAELTFANGVCDLIREISTDVNTVVAICEALIEDARAEITRMFTEDLPAGLESWAAEQQAAFSGRLDGLQQHVTETRDNFNQELMQSASAAVDDVRQQIHALREAARGLIGRIADAISDFIDDPVKFIIEGLLKLVGIPPASFWALVARIQQVMSDIADDPLGFANNLASALAQGFGQFFDNIGDHLLQGLLDWLFSGLGSVGVTVPSDFSLKSIVTFFLELMGITWPRVRALLAEEIGEENVALIEKAYELVSNLIELGPEGLFEMLKEQFNPQEILDQVLQAAIDFFIEALITQVSARIIALFNPAGAIVQAIELIYRVLSWVFTNAARIFRLIETVVNGAADLVAGNISGLASAIETALAGLLPTVIDFLAGYIGLGDLPEKIADTIRGFQDWIEGILRRVIRWLADRGRALLSALGFGGDEEGEGEGDTGDYDGQIGKVVTWTADGEGHRLWIDASGGGVTVLMASTTGTSILTALDIYSDKADELAEEDEEEAAEVRAHIGRARGLVTDLLPEATELAADVASGEDPAEIKAADDAIEALQEQLKTEVSQIQTKLGLDDDAEVQRAKAEFGDRLFSSSQELTPFLGVSRRTASRKTSKWTAEGILFRQASSRSDPGQLYSFDPTKAAQRETSPNNRSKYGYSNPAKTSAPGLAILSKGLRTDSPRPRQRTKAAYHTQKARYDSRSPGSSYRDFRFPDAILGHKQAMGASDHWNEFGHKQPKSANRAWNRDPSNYQGPEHRLESSASGGGSARYRVPAKASGSHSSWW